MRQTFPDMEPAEIRTLKRVVRMSKDGLNTFCMETRLRELSLYFALFEITSFCYLLVIMTANLLNWITCWKYRTLVSQVNIYISEYTMACHAITKALTPPYVFLAKH